MPAHMHTKCTASSEVMERAVVSSKTVVVSARGRWIGFFPGLGNIFQIDRITVRQRSLKKGSPVHALASSTLFSALLMTPPMDIPKQATVTTAADTNRFTWRELYARQHRNRPGGEKIMLTVYVAFKVWEPFPFGLFFACANSCIKWMFAIHGSSNEAIRSPVIVSYLRLELLRDQERMTAMTVRSQQIMAPGP
jgi:hypothetical protein